LFGARVNPGRGRLAGPEGEDDFGWKERHHQNKQAQKVRQFPRLILRVDRHASMPIICHDGNSSFRGL